MISTAADALIRDAGGSRAFNAAAGEAGGCKAFLVNSDDSDGALHQATMDVLLWIDSDPIPSPWSEVGSTGRNALRVELRFLVHRARTRARLCAKQFSRRARIQVSLAREGDHLLALFEDV